MTAAPAEGPRDAGPLVAHSHYSSHREALLEHLLVGEILKHLWRHHVYDVEVLKPQVDSAGFDVAIECRGTLRHIQLKSSFIGSTTATQRVHVRLAEKPSGCVIWVCFDPGTLSLGPFFWFGAKPGSRLPSLTPFKVARHTKANAEGFKAERAALRVVPRRAFEQLATTAQLVERLFGLGGAGRNGQA